MPTWIVPIRKVTVAWVVVIAETAQDAEDYAATGEWVDEGDSELVDWEVTGRAKPND